MTTATQPKKKTDLDTLCINTIRTLSLDAVQKANSGHPGLAARNGSGGLCSVDEIFAPQSEKSEMV